jgi:hypothetical protein
MTNEPEWLDIEQSTALVERAAHDVVEAFENITQDQRAFADMLVTVRYNVKAARELFRDQHNRALSATTLMRWYRDASFVAAVKAREDLSAQMHGLSKASVIANLEDIRDRNQARGETGDRLALSALELESKILGMFQNDESKKTDYPVGPALVIQVVARDGSVHVAPVNNGVEMNPPIPERLVNP